MFEFFSELTRIWRMQAYGGQLPSDQQLVSLCEQWRTVFSGKGN